MARFFNSRVGVDCPFCKKGFKIDTFVNCPHCGLKLPAYLALKDQSLTGPAKPKSNLVFVKKFISPE